MMTRQQDEAVNDRGEQDSSRPGAFVPDVPQWYGTSNNACPPAASSLYGDGGWQPEYAISRAQIRGTSSVRCTN